MQLPPWALVLLTLVCMLIGGALIYSSNGKPEMIVVAGPLLAVGPLLIGRVAVQATQAAKGKTAAEEREAAAQQETRTLRREKRQVEEQVEQTQTLLRAEMARRDPGGNAGSNPAT